MKKIIILNHKMNLLYDDLIPYIMKLNEIQTENNIIVCPSNIYLESFINYCDWGIGSQNVSINSSKNNTGGVSSIQLKSLGVEYSMVGHSDLGENDTIINGKVLDLLDNNIIPILCLNDDEKKVNDLYEKILILTQGVINFETLMLVYINNKELDFTLMEEKTKQIRNMIKNNHGKELSIIYGENIDSNNVEMIRKSQVYDGYMIGSLSSDMDKTINLL